MKKTLFIIGCCLIIVGVVLLLYFKNNNSNDINEIQATVLYSSDTKLVIQDEDNVIYTFEIDNMDIDTGVSVLIRYSGVLDKNKTVQDSKIVSYTIKSTSTSEDGIPLEWLDNGIFKNYYTIAYNKLQTMTLEEKVGQLFLVRYPTDNILSGLEEYMVSGYVFYEKDFASKTEEEVQDMINTLQSNSNIPLLTAVDEEGGVVVRVSSNSNLVSERFKSSQELYSLGGFERIKEDTIEKSKILKNLGLNLNLAPVVDVSENEDDYMYERSFGKNSSLTSTYAKTVIEASKNTGVSYTLKHFPGYGNNADTHTSVVTDTRTYDEIINNDIPPFEAGINAGCEAILVSHNIVSSIDSENPASLSSSIHNLLRDDLNFTGIIITDDIAMAALSSIDDVAVEAILAGNDLIITTDYTNDITSVINAVLDGTISENQIDKLAFRILAWKYYKGLLYENQK